MPSRFSVKIRTRRSFHFGGAPRGALAEGRQVRAEVLADPVDEPPGLGVGQVARLARRSPASGRGAPARGARAPPRPHPRGAAASAAAVTASIWAASSASSSSAVHSPRSSSASGAVVKRSRLVLGSPRRPAAVRLALLPLSLDRRPVDLEACARRPRSRRGAAAAGRRRAARRPPAPAASCSAKRSSRAVRYSSSRRDSTSSGASCGQAVDDDAHRRRAWGSRPGPRGCPP